MTHSSDFKVNRLGGSGRSAWRQYRTLMYGEASLGYCIKAELYMLFFANVPGAAGLALRKIFFPGLFLECGRGVLFGQGCTFRHARKIRLGEGVILDDHAVLDAKGTDNRGIRVGNGVYVGRHTIIYCKNGDIEIGDEVNISSNCQIFSSHRVTIGPYTMIAAFTCILSGGEYDLADGQPPFSRQSGTASKGPTVIGPNCWLATHSVIIDGVELGEHVVLAAGAVATRNIAPHQLCGGIPARPLKSLSTSN